MQKEVAIDLRKNNAKRSGDHPQEDLAKSLIILVVYFWLNTKNYGKYRNMAIFRILFPYFWRLTPSVVATSFSIFFSFFREISSITKKANERCVVTPVTLVSGCSVFFFLFFLMNFLFVAKVVIIHRKADVNVK